VIIKTANNPEDNIYLFIEQKISSSLVFGHHKVQHWSKPVDDASLTRLTFLHMKRQIILISDCWISYEVYLRNFMLINKIHSIMNNGAGFAQLVRS